jgi:erythromycin esterase-like protein
MTVPPAQKNSWEAVLHEQAPGNNLILLETWRGENLLTQRRGNRAIGVVYNPASESGNYVPTDLPHRYDALIFIDQTQALRPLPGHGGRQVKTTATMLESVDNY